MPNNTDNMPLKDKENFKNLYETVENNLKFLNEKPFVATSDVPKPVVFINDKKNLEKLREILDSDDQKKLEDFAAQKIPMLEKIDKILKNANTVNENSKKQLEEIRTKFMDELFKKLNQKIIFDTKNDPVLNLIRGFTPFNNEEILKLNDKSSSIKGLKELFKTYNPQDLKKPNIVDGESLPRLLLPSATFALLDMSTPDDPWYKKIHIWFSERFGWIHAIGRKNTGTTPIEGLIGKENRAYNQKIKNLNVAEAKHNEKIRKLPYDEFSNIQPKVGFLYNLRASLYKFLHDYNISRIKRTYGSADLKIVLYVNNSFINKFVNNETTLGVTATALRAAAVATINHLFGLLLIFAEQAYIFTYNIISLPYGFFKAITDQGESLKTAAFNIVSAPTLILGQIISPVQIFMAFGNIIRASLNGSLTRQYKIIKKDQESKNYNRYAEELSNALGKDQSKIATIDTISKCDDINSIVRKYLGAAPTVANKDPILKFFIDNYDKNKFKGSGLSEDYTLDLETFTSLYSYILSTMSVLSKYKNDPYFNAPIFAGNIEALITALDKKIKIEDDVAPSKTLKDLIQVVNSKLEIMEVEKYKIDLSSVPAPQPNPVASNAAIIIVTASFNDIPNSKNILESPVYRVQDYIQKKIKGDQPIAGYTTRKISNLWRDFTPRFANLPDYEIVDNKNNIVAKISISRKNNNFTLHVFDNNNAMNLIKAYIKFVDEIKGVQGIRVIKIDNISSENLDKLQEYIAKNYSDISIDVPPKNDQQQNPRSGSGNKI